MRNHINSFPLRIAFALLVVSAIVSSPGVRAGRAEPGCFVIVGTQVADGTGAPLRSASIRVCGDRISAVGAFRPREGEQVIQADGLVLAPGFIDPHNHSTSELEAAPLAESQVSQGITTMVLGLDGSSPWPVGDYLRGREASPAAANVMLMVGHATVRSHVMGDDFRRAAHPGEIRQMEKLVEQAMRDGAIGLSSGLEYEVGSYSTNDEVVALARVAARHGGIYATHIRDEADRSFEALREAIEIGRRARIPMQISHIKMGTVGVWGRAVEAVKLIEDARRSGLDITADCYPYDAWHSTLTVLIPSKRHDNPDDVAKGIADVGGAGNISIVRMEKHPEYEFRTLEEIARGKGITPVELYMEIVREGGADIIGRSMIEKDIRIFYTQPWVMVGSDGGINGRHPRSAGTYPKVIGRYVREQEWLTLPEAIRKMTSLPAMRFRLRDRGVIRPGAKADLVLFRPETVIDHSTFSEPQILSEGIEQVFVNGAQVWNAGKATGARPGRVLSKGGREWRPAPIR
jgi:N-acyl-D-amino-acid deacylase